MSITFHGAAILTRAIQKIERRYAQELACLPSGSPTAAHLTAALLALQAMGYQELGARLRVLRQIVFHRLYTLDCASEGEPRSEAMLTLVMQGMTDLAERCIQEAQTFSHAQLVALYGEPSDVVGQPSPLWTIGMGKLGARELNISSDIDLIYVYRSDGQTAAMSSHQVSISNQDFFTRQVQHMQALLADVTEHGFVFRVDLALRPYGRDGALALSLPTLAQYFQRAGREWERFAWLKSRVILIPKLGDLASDSRTAALPLRAVVRAFVFRRFLDYKVFSALRELHRLIRQNNGPDHGVRDVKLGVGGIREIEFAAQVLQIVRGGRQPELLARPTLMALQRLSMASLMDEETVQSLAKAYVFLRHTEHRIQYLDDQQTHLLPRDAQDAMWLARSMGFQDTSQFEWALAQHRRTVAAIFEQWLDAGIAPRKATVTLEQLQAKAAWTVSYVRKHPDVVDELQRPDILQTRFDAELFKHKVIAQYTALQATGLCDEEAVLDLLRRAHHIEVFRILVRDVQGLLSVRDVGDELSALADSVLALALTWCWQRMGRTDALADHFAVIAYGKLGGKELGYGSDLDIVFLYAATHPAAQDDNAVQRYIALVRKLTTWLTVKTAEGDMYEIDTALRPNGNSGLLVTSMEAYEKYQMQRGSNTAWTWELQAMTRARCVFGATHLKAKFDAIRAAVLSTKRDALQLGDEISAMRQKLYAAYPAKVGQFDIKHSQGGMMDVEFAVQYLVLSHSCTHPMFLDNVGNIALLQLADAQHLLPSGVGLAAADAYHSLRDQQHRARLQARASVLPLAEVSNEQRAVQALWRAIFERKHV